MKYLMLVCWDTEKMDAQTEPGPNDSPDEESFPWLDDLRARGIWVTGDQLAPPRRAAPCACATERRWSPTVRSPKRRKPCGGFDILECDSLEEAVEIAAGHPVAAMGTIEVRALWGG